MFRRFREKIERALERREQERPLSRDDVDRILKGMRDELVDLRARIPRMDREAERLAAQAQQEIRRAELAHGKGLEAERAGDSASAQSAIDAARRALQRAQDLRDQAAEARVESERLKADAADMMHRLKEAERNRSTLLARSRRAGTARKLDDLLRGPESGVRRFEKAEEDIEAAEDLAQASREVEEALGERRPLREIEADVEMRRLEAARQADEIETRLAELKRQIEDES